MNNHKIVGGCSMTAYEIWDQINHFVVDTKIDDAVCNIIRELYDDNKEDEAIAYLEDFFKCDNQTATEAFEIFKKKIGKPLSPQQIAHNNAVARELLNKPKCPTCQSTNLKKISTTSKVVNTAVWGIFGTKRHKTFHCNNCGYEW